MGYAVELSLDVRKESSWLSHLDARKKMAEYYECDMQYFTHEIEGTGKNIEHSDSIQVVYFSSDKLENLLEYVRTLRKEKRNYIDCIYQDDTTSTLLYASPKYVRKMDKHTAKAFKRERKFWLPTTDIEKKVFDAMKRVNY